MNEEVRTSTVPNTTPIFSIIAGVCLLFCFGTPMILITLPLMLTAVLAIVGIARKEHPRWIAIVALIGSILLFFTAASSISKIGSGSGSNLSAATIEDWNWHIDPEFGGRGTVKWDVAVHNLSDKPIESARVNFSTYDTDGHLLASTFTYVHAIPVGETRTDESYADYYGSEKSARATIADVRFSGE